MLKYKFNFPTVHKIDLFSSLPKGMSLTEVIFVCQFTECTLGGILPYSRI